MTISYRLKKRFFSSFSPIFIDRNKIFLDQLIDESDGSYFELKERHLCKIDITQAREQILSGEPSLIDPN